MKKKILFLVAAFALFVPSVLAAEPTLEDKNFFANGTSITVTDRTDGVEGALIKWEGGEQLVPATINIFGGSHNSDEKITTTNITIEGGTMHNVFGGGLHKSSVGTATVTVNGGKFTELVHGGGASSLSGTTCHTWYEGTDKTQATTVVENATLIINGGEFSSKSDAFGGGEGKSYTKKATLLINDTFTGDIRYVTGGGSNGWTDEVNVRLLGGKVKVLQAVNRGFTLNSEMTVDGATVENAYASAEGDNLELGVTESAVLDIVSGKVTNVAPGQSGNPNETAKDIAELSYVEGTVTNGTDSFADKNITVNVRLTLTSDNIKETISVPKGTKFTDEELQQLIDEINADLKADKFKLEGFFADKELKNKFDFSKEINADTTVYLKFTELKEETTVKEEKNPATNDMNLALILASLGLASAGAVLVSRKKLAKANR